MKWSNEQIAEAWDRYAVQVGKARRLAAVMDYAQELLAECHTLGHRDLEEVLREIPRHDDRDAIESHLATINARAASVEEELLEVSGMNARLRQLGREAVQTEIVSAARAADMANQRGVLRDTFAAAALQGLMADPSNETAAHTARRAYEIADAMLAARVAKP